MHAVCLNLHLCIIGRFDWAEPLSTATYLCNRSRTTAVCWMTPHEALTGEKPQVDGLRVFRCQAFVHISKDERKKLDSKSGSVFS